MDVIYQAVLGEIWELIKAAGAVLCIVFAYLWRMERDERKQEAARNATMVEVHRKEKEQITERVVNAINTAANVMQSLKEVIQAGRGAP